MTFFCTFLTHNVIMCTDVHSTHNVINITLQGSCVLPTPFPLISNYSLNICIKIRELTDVDYVATSPKTEKQLKFPLGFILAGYRPVGTRINHSQPVQFVQ